MLTLLASLSGFLTSFVPELISVFKQKSNHKQEIAILKLQIEADKQTAGQKLKAINVKADIDEIKIVQRTFYSGIKWVDALSCFVRPFLALSFFFLYVTLKIMAYVAIPEGINFEIIYQTLWTGEDSAIFGGIISYYYGQRSIQKYRNSR